MFILSFSFIKRILCVVVVYPYLHCIANYYLHQKLQPGFFFFPCSADHERDWPPCKVAFFELATNALNVRNNNNNNNNNNYNRLYYFSFLIILLLVLTMSPPKPLTNCPPSVDRDIYRQPPLDESRIYWITLLHTDVV